MIERDSRTSVGSAARVTICIATYRRPRMLATLLKALDRLTFAKGPVPRVNVVVIDCTEIGAPPPTGTAPTMIWRDTRRRASGAGGTLGIPRLTAVTAGLTYRRG